MTALTAFDLDDSGKIDLHTIYNQPDPRDYYQTLNSLEYCIPDEAAPVMRAIIAALRLARGGDALHLVDVGCSYGVNAAILKHGQTMRDLYEAYSARESAALSRQELTQRDRDFYRSANGDRTLNMIGVDVAARAVGYACQAGILDGGIVSDLETRDPPASDADLLTDTDLVISTGAIGYVGAPTFQRILDASKGSPWLALFALRMFPIDAIAESLAALGYSVFRLAGRTFKQRRFAGRAERDEVFANLATLGIDPAGLESHGWFHAEFFFARPATETGAAPIPGLVAM